ncbi:GHKL domain-containing protein [Deferribacter autotrophicus]|uniref:histidine kinase n=1 Tax=Deferribacter autotrophicus TaxID=500465 RepID=A0A5A8F3Z5_9BACT|nr:ATP-binding protein [Deferribacter autotrophicus]KAA0258687.1 GHKL domain-containing protein [Deferribacter autotrophicus]
MKLVSLIEQLFGISVNKLDILFNDAKLYTFHKNNNTGFSLEYRKTPLFFKLSYNSDTELDDSKKNLIVNLLETYVEFPNNLNSPNLLKCINTLDNIIQKENIETILKNIINQLTANNFIECAGIYFLNTKLLQLRGLIYHSKSMSENSYLFKKEIIEIKERNELSDILFFEQIKKITSLNNIFFPFENYGIGVYTSNGPVGLLIISIKSNQELFIENILSFYSKIIALAFEFTSTLKKYQFAIEDLNFFKENMYRNSNLINMGKLTATIAHELKNPLVSIGGFTNRLIKNTKDEKTLRYLNIIKNEVERMESLIKDLLFYSKNLQLTLEKVNLLNVIEEALSILYEKISHNDIDIKLKIQKDIHLFIDKNKILQVLLNIFNNSIDAMKGIDNKIEIISKTSNSHIILEIIDNGEGIPQENLAKIFTPFFTTKDHGSGLGLPICKKIMEAHKGDIKIFSDKNGTKIQLYFIKEDENG